MSTSARSVGFDSVVRSYHGPYRTAQPDSLRHRRLRMTGTKPHAPRGTAGRGTNWDRGPCAGHAAAARRCTKRHRRPWAVGPTGTTGRGRAAEASRRRMRISAPPAARPFLPISWDRGPYAGRRSCATRSGPTCNTARLRTPTLAPPAAGPARGPWAAGGP